MLFRSDRIVENTLFNIHFFTQFGYISPINTDAVLWTENRIRYIHRLTGCGDEKQEDTTMIKERIPISGDLGSKVKQLMEYAG